MSADTRNNWAIWVLQQLNKCHISRERARQLLAEDLPSEEN